MSHVLFVTSSPRGWQSYSHRTARGIVDDLKIQDPGVQVVVRDLARQPLPHTSEDYASSRALPADKRDQAAARALALSDAMVDELVAADVVVIAAPMHNFGIPSALKAWIDHIVRPGRTFSYSAQGPRGLLEGKKLVLVLARGGVYASGPMQVFDFQEPYLRTVLGFIGMTDIEVVRLEGLALGDEAVRAALASAAAQAGDLVRRIGTAGRAEVARAAA
ncbi:MAG TPA: NAD(P)H-dependent oxidoreductase [Casimicrobiaceae bacterium]|jgi:FMN-dependent NADH-azoreductase|nr:NAD(P)H-dependent oxidoreductase [Casimicrobiaceae bacterium]